MKRLRTTKPLWHALVWIALYVALVNVGDVLSSRLSDAVPITGILLTGLSIVLLLYLWQIDRAGSFGLKRPRSGTLLDVLYLVPLFAVAAFQFAKGFAPDLDAGVLLSAGLVVAGVAFVEELLFRGFLFQALRERGTLNRAIVISGVTFGIGHIVNLGRGYSVPDQLIQVVGAVAIGVALAYCVALTGSIVPGAVFHALFNLGGTITNPGVVWDTYIVGAIIVVMVPYVLFMRRRLGRVHSRPPAAPMVGTPARLHGPG